jgi:hypothetical protein
VIYNLPFKQFFTVRKWKSKTALGGDTPWTYEVGEADAMNSMSASSSIVPSSQTPQMARRDTRTHFTWRIRNLHYPKETYRVSVDERDQVIVVKTSNKKYYKRIDVPDLRRKNLPLNANALCYDYGSSTLVITVSFNNYAYPLILTNTRIRA